MKQNPIYMSVVIEFVGKLFSIQPSEPIWNDTVMKRLNNTCTCSYVCM